MCLKTDPTPVLTHRPAAITSAAPPQAHGGTETEKQSVMCVKTSKYDLEEQHVSVIFCWRGWSVSSRVQ